MRQTAVAAVLVGVGAEATGLLGGRLGVLLAEALCGPDCGLGIFALAIPVVMPLLWLGTAAGAGLVAALVARRAGRRAIRPGLLVAAGTALALAAAVALVTVMPLRDDLLIATPFIAGVLGYLMEDWWSNRRKPDSQS